MEAANLSVSITGDASGLISSLQSAEAAIGQLHSSAGRLMGDFDGKEAKMKLTAIDNTASGVASAKANIASVTDKTVTISVRYAVSGMPKLAGGTRGAPGGLSVINDERGKSDPRELVEHKGRLFMFEGRDVIVPLSSGDKVYTADETQRIMRGIGLPHYASGKNNSPYDYAKADFTHYKKTHIVSPGEELAAWQELMSKFSYDSEAVLDIEEQIFAAEQKIIAEQEKALKERKKANDTALNDYKKHSDAWIKYQTDVNDMSVSGQIEAYQRQLYNYNAMVSEMVASTDYTAEEIKAVWDDFYEYKAGVDLKIGKLENERNHAEYEKWQSHAKNWKLIRDTYDDWEESGDSKIKFYERSLDRIREMYEGKNIGWQEYRDDSMAATLNLYKARMEGVESILGAQKQYIRDTKSRFSDEENALREKWTVSDRKADKSEISDMLTLYRGAVTERGKEKYKSLQEQMKKIKREEEMYALQKKHTQIVTDLEKSYTDIEDNKNYLLSVIEKNGLDLEGIVSGARYDIQGMQSTLRSLFSQTISAIKGVRVSQSSYSDNRNISINGASSSAIEALEHRVIGSIAHGNFY